MKPFNHTNAKTLDEAVSALGCGKSSLIAGGTDLLGTLKDNILPDYPSLVVNLKIHTRPRYIKEEDDMLKIGALTRLADIADHRRQGKVHSPCAGGVQSCDAAHKGHGHNRPATSPSFPLWVFPQGGKPIPTAAVRAANDAMRFWARTVIIQSSAE
jgi:hypothetical protein